MIILGLAWLLAKVVAGITAACYIAEQISDTVATIQLHQLEVDAERHPHLTPAQIKKQEAALAFGVRIIGEGTRKLHAQQKVKKPAPARIRNAIQQVDKGITTAMKVLDVVDPALHSRTATQTKHALLIAREALKLVAQTLSIYEKAREYYKRR